MIDKLPDAANLALTALVFSQFLSERPLSLAVAAGGLAAWVVRLGGALLLAEGNEHG